jgi:TrmH family RNA methyltransferase
VQNNVISSTKSNRVKKIQGLLNKRKKRVELGQTIVEGPRLVFDLLNNLQTGSLVQQVLVSVDEYEGDYQWRLAAAASSSSETFVQLVTPPVLKACSDTVTPQGIVALVDIPDGVSDPGNLGTLLRSFLVVGVAGVVLLPECCDVWNPEAVRSAMGASFLFLIVQVSSWQEALE